MKRSVTKIVLLLAVMGLALWRLDAKKPSLTILAQQAIATCQNATSRAACYEREVPKFMDTITMEDVFEVTRMIQEKDPSYAYCHTMGHALSFREAEKNQAEWKDVLTRCPLSMCNYGCLHGSLIKRFRGEVLSDEQLQLVLPDLQDVCEPREGWNPTILDQSMCYHALGHLALYISGADIQKSHDICAAVSSKSTSLNGEESCLEGIFMTILYAPDPEDFELTKDVRPEKKDVFAFCGQFEGNSYHICRREIVQFFEEEIKDPGFLVQFCSYATKEKDIQSCYFTIFNRLTDWFLPQQDWLAAMTAYCATIAIHKDLCFSGFVTRLVQTDVQYQAKAIELCKASEQYEKNIESACWESLSSYAMVLFHRGSSDYRAYCEKLPEYWKEKCAQQMGKPV